MEEKILKEIGGSYVCRNGKVDGLITVSDKKVMFEIADIMTIANFDKIEIPFDVIDTIIKEKYLFVFPKITFILKNGAKESFLLLVHKNADNLIRLIESQMKK